MSWLNFFFGFHGRIRRLQFHLGALVPFVLYLPGMYSVWQGIKAAIAMKSGVATAADLLALHEGTGGPLNAVLSLVALYMMLTLNTKRLHDLGKSGWWQGIAFIGLPIALAGMVLVFVPGMSGLGIALCLGSFVVSIWGMWIVIQIWFFAGQPGSNAYGPPPGSSDVAAYLANEIEQLEASARPTAARSSAPTPVASANTSSRPARTPSVQSARPSGFGRRNPRMA